MVKIATLTTALAVAITGVSADCTKPCVPNVAYCGWELLDVNRFNCTMEDLRNTKGGQYWDSRYTCAADAVSADEIEWCPGGQNHCKPASDSHCDQTNACCF